MSSFRNKPGVLEEFRAQATAQSERNWLCWPGFKQKCLGFWAPKRKRRYITPGLQTHATIEYVIYYARGFCSQLRCGKLQYGVKQPPLWVPQKRRTLAGTGERDAREVSGIHEESTRLTHLHPLARKLKGCKTVVFVSSSNLRGFPEIR